MAQDKNTSDIEFMPVIFETAAEDFKQEREDNVRYEVLVPEVESGVESKSQSSQETMETIETKSNKNSENHNLKNSKSYENLDQQIFELITEKYHQMRQGRLDPTKLAEFVDQLEEGNPDLEVQNMVDYIMMNYSESGNDKTIRKHSFAELKSSKAQPIFEDFEIEGAEEEFFNHENEDFEDIEFV